MAWPGLAAGLALILALEWRPTGPGPAPQPLPVLPADAPMTASADAAKQWADTALARPLFAASRRPDGSAAAPDSGLGRLSAIIIAEGSRSAIFAVQGQKPHIVAEGGEIGGYRLRRIGPDAVDLTGPSGPLTLHPQFPTPAPAPTVQPLPAAPPSAADIDNE
jgi:general secretion pathway protein N